MDPISQAFLGAIFAQSFSKIKKDIKAAAFCGAIGGMAPDLDIFIRSKTDPLLQIDYHRHFTHSISFIPAGGLLTAIFLYYIIRYRKISFKKTLIFSTLGISTHALLDACTTYGTRLLWPFSNARISWNIISIIDLIYTVPLIIFCFLSIRKKSQKLAISGLLISFLYIGICSIQNYKAKYFIHKEAQKRGHNIKTEDIFVSPTIGNNILWRSIYKYQGDYYIDAVRISFFSNHIFYKGQKEKIIDPESIFPNLSENSIQRKDIRRFSHFAQGYINFYQDKQSGELLIGDLRYSLKANDSKPLWSIKVDINNPNSHVKFLKIKKLKKEDISNLKNMLTFDDKTNHS